MRVWIDCSNSPHPLLFSPVAECLRGRGHEVVVTARDNAQTVELTRQHFPESMTVGGESPKSRLAKGRSVIARVQDLARWARRARPDVALSHNSYAQIAAAKRLGLPIVTAMDYEHQPANHLAFRLADRVLLPEALAVPKTRRQGAGAKKTRFYAGLKEEVYLADFSPNTDVLRALDLDGDLDTRERSLLVVRTPPSRALYHRAENALFAELITELARRADLDTVILARHREQRAWLESFRCERFKVPVQALDSRSLIFFADGFIGAGGTMTREAALMGVPTLSLFEGRPAAVDTWLQERGLLKRMTALSDLRLLGAGQDRTRQLDLIKERSRALVELFADEVEAVA